MLLVNMELMAMFYQELGLHLTLIQIMSGRMGTILEEANEII